MTKSWTIGASPDCDLVVDLPTVSGRHCRLTLAEGGLFILEDLGSTNGTFLNGKKVSGSVNVVPGDAVTLGQTIPMPWPVINEARPTVLRIGREPDNDVVVNLPTVSGYHARIISEGRPNEAILEDLGSSNGTSVGDPDRKITRAFVSAADTIYLGSHAMPAAPLLARMGPAPDRASVATATPPSAPDEHVAGRVARAIQVPPPLPKDDGVDSMSAAAPGRSAEDDSADVAEELLRVLRRPWLLAGLLTQGLVVGLVTALALKSSAPDAASAQNIAAPLFWLGLAAVWFGLSSAFLGLAWNSERFRGADGTTRLARLLPLASVYAIVCVFQCLLAWAPVVGGSGLSGMGFAALALLVLSAAVGLMTGMAVMLMTPHARFAWGILPLAVIALWLFGGQTWPLPRMSPWARVVAGVVPSRWTFEGLLLLASDGRAAGGSAPAPDADVAEPYFPARTERMGVSADAIALGAMLVGFTATVTFLAADSKPKP